MGDARCFRPARPTGWQPASHGRGGASAAIFSPAAGGQRAGKVALSLPTSLSSAVPELISAWHLERWSCPALRVPGVLLLLFWLSPSQLFPTKQLRKSRRAALPAARHAGPGDGRQAAGFATVLRHVQNYCPCPKRGAACLCCCPLWVPTGGMPRGSRHPEGCTVPGHRCHAVRIAHA